MLMYDDYDIKIAGNKPSDSVKKNMFAEVSSDVIPEEKVQRAKKLGSYIADKFSEASDAYSDAVEDADENMFVQRVLLLSFTVTAVFEAEIVNDVASGIAQKSFLDTVKKKYKDIFPYTSDTGAFTFYYLAFRRGSETERRIGQTFAMLCSHDGDPIYQELGEVLFCWFSSVVKDAVNEYGLHK